MEAIETKLRESLRPLYVQLIKDIERCYQEDDLVCFAAQWGKFFPEETNDGVLFVGRATNGWTCLTPDVDVLFGETNNAIFNLPNQMEWVDMQDRSKIGYNSRQSAFWRVIRKVSRHLYPEPELSHVAWSNVCKIAPDGANPNDELYYAQLNTCQRILKAEIDSLAPKFVIFLTGLAWCKDFLYYLIPDRNQRPLCSEAWGNYDVKAFEHGGIYYLVSEHPQSKPEDEHAQAIIRLIDQYK